MADIEIQSSNILQKSNYNTIHLGKFFFIFDWIILIIVFGIAQFVQTLTPFQRQFLINDISISYKFQEDSVSYAVDCIISILVPIIIFVICSILAPRVCRIIETYRAILGLGQSVCTTLLITDIFKVAVGELRPHFLDICKPDASMNCTGPDPLEIRSARMSFVSGHTSMAFSGLFYLSLFLVRAFRFRFAYSKNFESISAVEWNSNYRARFFMFAAIITPTFAASLIGLSRISDYHHHGHDVIWAAILGILVAYSAFRLQFPFVFYGNTTQLNSNKDDNSTV